MANIPHADSFPAPPKVDSAIAERRHQMFQERLVEGLFAQNGIPVSAIPEAMPHFVANDD